MFTVRSALPAPNVFSSLLGRSVTNENSITFNLEGDSIFRNLRILTFRNITKDFSNIDLNDAEEVIKLMQANDKELRVLIKK